MALKNLISPAITFPFHVFLLLPNLSWGTPFQPDSVSPLNIPAECSERLIEPTSPVLGTRLAQAIQSDPRDPAKIFRAIQQNFPEWKHDITLSVIAYLDAIGPGLSQMCDNWMARSAPPSGGWTELDTGSIPVEALAPFENDYFSRIESLKKLEKTDPTLDFQGIAQTEAISFQAIRDNCKEVQTLKDIENAFHDLCLFTPLSDDCDKLIRVNDRVMSMEVAYPRTQFSINGFTEYVYDDLFKYSVADLEDLLEKTYRIESAWLADARAGTFSADFFSTVEQGLTSSGYSPRTALLVLEYSTRNMPSLDWRYAISPDRALLSEVYFWKFRQIRDELTSRFDTHIYPNHVFKEDPGVYHYAAAALQSCVVKLAGFSRVITETSAFAGETGYKIHKLFSAMELHDLLSAHGFDYITGLANEQGFQSGVEAGLYGGEHGAKFCETTKGTQ